MAINLRLDLTAKEALAPFHFSQGDSPLLISMPHCGTALLPDMTTHLSEQAKSLPDTDWFIPELYDFATSMGASVIQAHYSRYVVDLNRPVDDQPLYASKTTGLFPEITFADHAVFHQHHTFDDATKAQIKAHIWQPYHQHIADELSRLHARYGYAILFDAHSIAAEVPMLFEGTLPDFNFGNNDGLSCSHTLLEQMCDIIRPTSYSHIANGRFKGGYITRHFGQPAQGIHAIQLELSQATYLSDSSDGYQLDAAKHQKIQTVLKPLIETLLHVPHSAITNF